MGDAKDKNKEFDERQKTYLFLDLIREYGNSINRELINTFLPVFKHDNILTIETIKGSFNDFYVNCLFPEPNDFNYDFHCEKPQVSKVTNKENLNFENALYTFKSRNNGTLEKYLEYIINTTDFSNFLRFFRNLSKKNSENQKLIEFCLNKYNRDLSQVKYNKIFQNGIEIRNAYSHETNNNVKEFLSDDVKRNALDSYKNVSDIFFNDNFWLATCYASGERIIESQPISFAYILKKYSDYQLNDEALFNEFGKNYNFQTKKLYGYTFKKLDEKITRLAKPEQIEKEINYENSKVENKNVVHNNTEHNATVIFSLLNYQNEITEVQIIDIAKNIPIFIDGKVFEGNGVLDDNGFNQRLINNKVLAQLEKNKKYAVVNFSSRIELNVKTNKGETEKVRILAKNARDVISYFVSRGSIKYGQSSGQVYSKGVYETLKLAQQNKKDRFFIIVNNLEDANLIDDETSNCLVARIIGFGDKKKLVFTKKTVAKLNNIANYIGFTDIFDIANTDLNKISTLKEEKAIVTKQEATPSMEKKTQKVETPAKKKAVTKIPVFGSVVCKPEDGKPLPLTTKVVEGTKLYDQNNNEVVLKELVGEGGEGAVYYVDENTVAKIYNNKHLTQNRKEKLELLIESEMKINKVCLPKTLLFNEKKEFVGYTMPRASEEYLTFGESILQLTSKYSREQVKYLNTWNRESLARLCSKLAKTFQRIHENNLLIGDINANNLLINLKDNQGSDFLIVDTDSFQVGPYPSPVGTPVFTSPEIYKRENTENPRYGDFLRTINDEEYAIASLLFQIIMLGQVPFAGKGVEGEGIEALKNYNFDFRGEKSTGADTPDGPYRMIWANTPKNIKEAFEKVFTGKGIVKCEEWSSYFFKYAESIKFGKSDNSLMPYRYPKSDIMTEFKCELCGREANLPKTRYEYLQKYSDILRCTECDRKKIRLMKEQKIAVQCQECGSKYEESKYETFRNKKDPKRIRLICDKCNEEIEHRCSRCGNFYKEKVYRIRKYGVRAMCKECNEAIRNKTNAE